MTMELIERVLYDSIRLGWISIILCECQIKRSSLILKFLFCSKYFMGQEMNCQFTDNKTWKCECKYERECGDNTQH